MIAINPTEIRRAAARLCIGKCGRRGLAPAIIQQMIADYQSGLSCSDMAPIYGRTRQSIHGVLVSHGCQMRPDSTRRKRAGVIVDGVCYSPSGRSGHLRATGGDRHELHHRLWERAHGPIPPGHQVSFLDGNPLNVALTNLFCDTVANVSQYQQRRLHPDTATLPPAEKKRYKAAVAAKWYWARKARFKAQGLRCDGKPLRRGKVLSEEERWERTRKQQLAKWERRAQRNVEAGLTTRGTERIYQPRKGLSETENAYLALKAEIEDGEKALPIATGFRAEAGIARGGAGANGRGFMNDLITRGTEKQRRAA